MSFLINLNLANPAVCAEFRFSKEKIAGLLRKKYDELLEELMENLPALKKAIEDGVVKIELGSIVDIEEPGFIYMEDKTQNLWGGSRGYGFAHWGVNIAVCSEIVLRELPNSD